jgi:hypothetical protein
MNKYSSVFSQLLSLFPRLEFERLVKLTGTEYAAKGFSSWDHYVPMLFCQLGQEFWRYGDRALRESFWLGKVSSDQRSGKTSWV